MKIDQQTKDLIKTLADALEEAEGHLEYCGYGDSWERECAVNSGLPEQIKNAITLANNALDRGN